MIPHPTLIELAGRLSGHRAAWRTVEVHARRGLGWLALVLWSFAGLHGPAAELAKDRQEAATKADALVEEGRRLLKAGRLNEAVTQLENALRLRKETLGTADPKTLFVMHWLGNLYRSAGNYPSAELRLKRVIEVIDNQSAPDKLELAKALHDLGILDFKMGNYALAELHFKRALTNFEATVGPEHALTANALGGLGGLYEARGDFPQAEEYARRAADTLAAKLGTNHPMMAVSWSNLGLLYGKMGDYARAEPLQRRALKIVSEVRGSNHPQTAMVLHNLAGICTVVGNYAEAERHFHAAVEIRKRLLGSENPETLSSVKNLGDLYGRMGRDAEALQLLQEARAAIENKLGSEHPEMAAILAAMSATHSRAGRYGDAEPLAAQAEAIWEKVLGANNPNTAMALHNLAAARHFVGDAVGAEAAARQHLAAEEHFVEDVLSFAPERQRLAFQRAHVSLDLLGTLGEARLLAPGVLQRKGFVLDSLLEDRLVANEKLSAAVRDRLEELRTLRQRLMQLQLGSPRKPTAEAIAAWMDQMGHLRKQAEQLESDLARRITALGRTRRALHVTVEQVQEALPPQTALLEFVHYHHFLTPTSGEDRYGAVFLARKGDPKWVPLARSAREIGTLLKTCRELTRTPEAARSGELEQALREIYDAVWAGVHQALPKDTRTVIISPDAELNFLSFATLLTPQGHFLGEDLLIRYVSSGRDLLRASAKDERRTLAVWAHPQYDAQPKPLELTAANSEQRRDSSDFRRWESLPGTLAEATNLLRQAKSFGFEQTLAHIGPEATESALKQLASPYVLHLATHGFFLSDGHGRSLTDTEERSRWPAERSAAGEGIFSASGGALVAGGLLKHPMHRSGLALAGANVTVSNWLSGRVPAPENDGVLLAEEVVDLNLAGTWLVVLSACDTGLGEARSGEGVLGLRRAFVQAGAQHLLMTLWPVSDTYTSQFMTQFYQRAMASGDASTALAELQREELRRLKSVKDVQAAVQRAGAFVLSSQGN